MTIIAPIARFVVDAFILFGLTFIALFVYSMYTQNPAMINAIYCLVNTDTDLGFNACLLVHN